MGLLSIGIVLVFGIILMPVIILVLASIFGKPRNFRVTAVFLGSFVALMLLGLAVVWLISAILDFVVP